MFKKKFTFILECKIDFFKETRKAFKIFLLLAMHLLMSNVSIFNTGCQTQNGAYWIQGNT